MSNLRQQNILNIDNVAGKANETANGYERKSFIFLQISWILWMFITVIGVAIAILELIGDGKGGYKIAIAIMALSISTIGMIQTKFKPYKKGYLYKNSASRIRKLGRSAQKLKWSKLTPEEVSVKIENIFDEVDDIALEIFSTNEAGQGIMNEGFGEGPKIISDGNVDVLSSIVIDNLRNDEDQVDPK